MVCAISLALTGDFKVSFTNNGIASLEGYLDDMIFGEDSSIKDTTEEVINNVLLPDYVECLEAKELLQMLLENELPPVFKSQIAKLHPAEEELVIILRKNNLPISLYKELIDWAHRASSSNYEFSSPTYMTALDRMKKKYLLEAGTAPLRSTIEVEGESFPPMHVYCFSVLHQVKRLLQSKELLEGALWRFKPKFCPDTNERVYQQLNSGEWWELAERKMDHDLKLLGAAKPPGLHFILLIILYDNSLPFVTTLGVSLHSLFCVLSEPFVMTSDVRFSHGLYLVWCRRTPSHPKRGSPIDRRS